MNEEHTEEFELVSLNNGGGVSVVPLGGLGEIGMNCMIYEFDGQIMLVDCGMTFPDARDYGVDQIVPTFDYLEANADRVVGLVVTHGHEDHIGAIPYLLRDLNPPIYAAPLPMALIRNKLREHGLFEHAKLHEVSPGAVLELGPFTVELIHVNHSMPHSCSLAIRTPVGMLIHTSDFKVDYGPSESDPIDLARFAALGEEGVLCLLSDSTNVEKSGHTRSESWVAERLREIIERAPGRVIVTLFASNLFRVQSLLDIAHEQNRRVLILGRSLLNTVAIGRELGILHLPNKSIIIEPNEVGAYRYDELLVMSTGSQGEPRSAMTRMAFDDYPHFNIDPGDYVIFSSRTIPGNEKAVSRVVNHLHLRGAEVFDWPTYEVHASGHAYREEQKLLISLTHPLLFVPIHGEYRHLVKHAALAENLDVGETFILSNGDVLTFWEDSAELTGRIAAGKILVDGKTAEDASSVNIRDRKRLAHNGIVVAWLVLDANTGEIHSGPRLLSHGVIMGDVEEELLDAAISESITAIGAMNAESRRHPAEVGETLRLAVRRAFNRRIDNKPVVVPVVHEL